MIQQFGSSKSRTFFFFLIELLYLYDQYELGLMYYEINNTVIHNCFFYFIKKIASRTSKISVLVCVRVNFILFRISPNIDVI